MAINLNTIKGDVRPVRNRVLVTDMYFGEQKTAGGLIINDDDGKTRGIYPRWGKVYAKGPENKDEYNVGDWILIEHGRWTRSIIIEVDGIEKEIRMVEAESILAMSDEKPGDVYIGAEYTDGPATIDPSSFVRTDA
jgi:co-chaperonin GroES (HSP10)